MTTAILRAKGQITIPASFRAVLGLKAGSRIEFVDDGNGKFAIVAATIPVKALKGLLNKLQEPVSIDEMNKVIVEQGVCKR